jgi:hypothetical protein
MPKPIAKEITLTDLTIGQRRLVLGSVDGKPRWHIQYLYAVLEDTGHVYKQADLLVPVDEAYQDLFTQQIQAADDAVRFAEGLMDEAAFPADPAEVIAARDEEQKGVDGVQSR